VKDLNLRRQSRGIYGPLMRIGEFVEG